MKKIKVAITGGIGSGKSTVAKYIEAKGYPVFSCDEIYKEIYDSESFQALLRQSFPSCQEDGKIDKKQLSKHVFSNTDELKKLNDISHSKIMSTIEDKVSACHEGLVFVEVPLLFERGYENAFDFVFVVLREKNARVTSVVARDKISTEEVILRISSQWDYDTQENLSYLSQEKFYVIKNENNVEMLLKKIDSALFWLNTKMKQ